VIRAVASAVAATLVLAIPQAPLPIPGLTGGPLVARAYDAVLDAEFDAPVRLLGSRCTDAPPEACSMLDALGVWWAIALEPESRMLDVRFSLKVDAAIDAATAWTVREPNRAEAWFYLGAAYGARVQWRVLREQRLSAARDGSRVKDTLERAIALDPSLVDAKYGIGLYRYYADVAPAALRMLRWLLRLPGGNRDEGLRQIEEARLGGLIVRGEADYQLHLIYLWYEKRSRDALALVRDLQHRYPHNPLFYQLEAEIHDVYFHDAAASLAASTDLLARAQAGTVRDAELANVRARLNIAIQLDRLGRTAEAIDTLRLIVTERPSRPFGVTARAQALLHEFMLRCC
jgi:tetratricopeptide (TPR) repeat protein